MYTKPSSAVVALALAALLGGALAGCRATSPYQGMTADDLFALGASKFAEEDWDDAVEVFERLVFAEPTYDRLVEARMYLARAYFNKGDYITAVAEFSRILDRHPGHELAAEASLGACKAYVEQSPHVQRDQRYTVQAWSACQHTANDFAGTAVAAEAAELRDRMEDKMAHKIYIAGDFYYRRSLYNSGIIYFNELLQQYPRNKWAAGALLRLYQSYAELGWDREAEETKERLLRNFPDSDAAAEARAEAEPEGTDGTPPDTGSVALPPPGPGRSGALLAGPSGAP